ncbi:hypothetical protein A0J50_08595 [Acinetobacter sp. DUT-2]|nr:hypothetical protein A0J50_08595 [Acinetobacter sp. DUT-2]
MIKKYSISLLCLIITLLIIFYVTYFNQQRYYDIQEKNRIGGFELLLEAKSETNKVCLKYSTQRDCYQNFVKSLEHLNPRGSVQLTNSEHQVIQVWDNERHKDDRENVSVSKTFTEFDSRPVVTLSKLTRHQNLYKSSFNAMFFSILDYSEAFRARVNGLPSTFGEMTPYTFAKYVAWGRFYPILPIWIIALGLLGYILTILFKNIGFNHSIKNLQEEIINKEKTLRSMHDESELIKADFSKLHKESTENLKILNNEKLEYTNKINALGLELNEIHQDRITLLNKIQSFETQNRINTEEKERLQKSLEHQRNILENLDKQNKDLEQNISNNSSFMEEFNLAKNELAALESLYAASKNTERDLSKKLDGLNQEMSNLNNKLVTSESQKDAMMSKADNKESELKDYLEYVSDIENQFKLKLETKNQEVEVLKSEKLDLESHKADLQYELDKLSGTDTSSRKIYNILISNPDLPKSKSYEYSEPEHHSKAYLKSIQNSFNSQKNNKIGNLITDLRGTKFNSKTPNTLRIVYNYAVSPDITRSGYGLVAVEKEHGYAAYLHLTARNPSEAMLAAKAIQTYCSIFKGYRIIPLSS